MKVLTAAQMREVDRLTTERFGVPSLQLMENAGARVLELLRDKIPDLPRRRIVILCGKGNNGGDGLVVARLLKQAGAQPAVYLFAAPESVKGDAAVNLQRWGDVSGNLRTVTSEAEWLAARESLADAEVLVDALLGTGLTGPVDGLLRGVIEDVNRLCVRAVVVAVDIPSGLPSDTGSSNGVAIRAHYTVTFTAPKPCQLLPPNCASVGELRVGAIGTPAELMESDTNLKLHWLEPSEFRSLPLRRDPGGHKGDYGHALLVAGSRGKTGAAVLAGWGALRAGAGLATVATPGSVLPIVAGSVPEMMTEALESTEAGTVAARTLDYGRLDNLMRGKSVVAVGPGLSTHTETRQVVRALLAECPLPLILDADGLNTFSGHVQELKQRRTAHLALTPHPGEMARLLGCTTAEVQPRRLEVALECAAAWNAIIVLKGHGTVVAAPGGRAFINSTGNPGMATGGTGDVLTGILAGLTAQYGVEDWARVLGMGVYLHGLAGDIAAEETGEAPLMASDLLRAYPRAWQQMLRGFGHE